MLEEVDKLLGLNLSNLQDVDQQIKDLIVVREKAREAKGWPAADKLRKQLAERGIEINDTPHGPIWSRV
ncbi:hypothetical protein HYU82_01625 [Candidatus Saccharibacteria bacterium]|nr:hypothetical protein [Candidatus Saccharibacteria bacterium]